MFFNGDAVDSSKHCAEDNNIFPTRKMAEGYAKAFHMMLMLRKQPGSGTTDNNGCGYYIAVDLRGTTLSFYPVNVGGIVECFSLAPPFPNKELLRNAVEAVGGERAVIEVMKFLANVKD